MITPEMRAAVVAGLLELRAFWPALPDNEHTVRALTEELEGYTPEEIAAAFRTVRSEHQHASSPKPWHVKQAAANAARRLRMTHFPPRHTGDIPAVPDFCPKCHTPDLYETPFGRFKPWHRAGCDLEGRDDAQELRLAQEGGKVWSRGRSPESERRRITATARLLETPEPEPAGDVS